MRSHLPRNKIFLTFPSSIRSSTAIVSGAGEEVKMLWITLVASTLNLEFDEPILVAIPNDSLDSCAVVHREIRYCAREIFGFEQGAPRTNMKRTRTFLTCYYSRLSLAST
jgi:hypothetical protein